MTKNLIDWQANTVMVNTGLNIAYERAGLSNAPVIILVGGLGCQLTIWHDAFCLPLIEAGYQLIRFDNRDIGLTDEHPNPKQYSIPQAFFKNYLGKSIKSNYRLELMADDLLGLIDALGLDQPHLVGISMGGMISQIATAKAGEKIGKLVTLMSSTNHPKLPGPTPKVMFNMFLRKPKSKAVDDVVEHVERVMTTIGSPGYPPNLEALRQRTRAAYARSYKPAGVLRQTHCVVANGSIEEFTKQIKNPTCIIHGLQDPLLKKECGERIHKLIPGSKLHLIDGLGHDLPDELGPRFANLIHTHISS